MSKPLHEMTPQELFAEYWAKVPPQNKSVFFGMEAQSAFYAGMAAAGAQMGGKKDDEKSLHERIFGKL